MARRWSALALGAAVAAVAVAGTASGAGTGDQLTSSWAKLNVCNPAQLGARAQLAGDGSSSRMAVRFTAEWLSPDGWVPLSGNATSPWQDAGSAEFTWQQAGWTFSFVQPPEGTTYVMRGVVELEWRDSASAAKRLRRERVARERSARKRHRARTSAHRRHARRAQQNAVVQRRTLLTKTGMKGVQGGDPAGLSKAMCLIW